VTAIRTVGVLGCGLMGSGIAQATAVAGYRTVVRDTSDEVLRKGRQGLERSLGKLVDKGTLAAPDREATLGRLTFVTALEAVGDADLVVEAVPEDLALKNTLWRELDGLCRTATIFASNTSSLRIGTQAAATSRPDRFVGLHFFNPVPLMPLVEVVRGSATSAETFDQAMAFARSLGKEAVVSSDTSGFLVNRLLVPYLLDAVRAFEHGTGSIADLDTAMRLGCGHPMGPFTLLDLVGLDTVMRIAGIMLEEYGEPRFAPPPLLRRLVAAGHYGRKSGRGFYDYSVSPPRPVAVSSER
jgi:3-hydroxybutyryl-CoA dehydrogenase